jgi:Tfp pilus assembly protein PilF
LRDLEDHRILIAGVGMLHELRLANFARSRELIEEAMRRAPRSAEAHAWLGEWYVMSIFNGWSTDQARDTQLAVDSTARALDIDPENAFCLTVDGAVNNNLLQRLDVAEDRFSAALSINPNEPMAWLSSGVLHAYRDDGAAAVKRVEKALRLSPLDPFGYFYDSLAASAYLSTGDFAQALQYADRSFNRNDRHLSTLRARICALHHLGRAEEAKASALELLRRKPDFTIGQYMRSHPAAGYRFGQMHADALRAAGVP